VSYFDDVDNDSIDVSALKKNKEKTDIPSKNENSVKALELLSEEQGWPNRAAKKPGPKRREPRTVLTMNGPNRVLDTFRAYADDLEVSQWKALEQMMKELKII
jgi:hypothetical protein